MIEINQPPWSFTGASDTVLDDLSNQLEVSTEQQAAASLAQTTSAIDGLLSTLSSVQSVKLPTVSFASLQDTSLQDVSLAPPGVVDWSYTPAAISAVAFEYQKPTMGGLLSVTMSSATAPAAPSIQYNSISLPSIQAVTPTLPALPADITTGSIGSISVGELPVLTAVAPTVSTLSAPLAFDRSAPVMNILLDRQYPDAPERNLPDTVVLRNFSLPDSPEMLSLEFSGTLPILVDAPPDLTFDYTEAVYDSDLLDALKTKLLDMVHTKRQTGLDTSIQQTILAAGHTRTTSVGTGLLNQVSRHFNRMGWEDHEYLVERKLEAQEFLTIATLSTTRSDNILLSELEQKNFLFAIEKSVELEGRMLDLHNKVQQRSFDAAKAIISAAVSVYKLKASYFNTAVVLYGAQAQVYKTRIQAELSKAELYKAQVDGQKLIGELNTQAVDNYTAQIDAVVALHGLYSAELEAVKTKLEGDALKIKQFEAAIEAFSTEIEAKSLEYDGYKTAMSGEEIKAKIYDSLVSAYGAQIDGYSTGVEAQILKLDADIMANVEAPLQVSEQAVKRFTTLVGAESKYLGALAKSDSVAVDIFSTMIDAEKSRVSNTAEIYSAEVAAFKAVNSGEASKLKIISSINSTSAEIYKSEVAAEVANIETIVALDSNKVDIISALTQQEISNLNIDVANHKASVDSSNVSVVSRSEIANAQAEENKAKATLAINKMEASLDIATTEINRSLEEKETAVKVMIAAAQAQAQIIAARAATSNIHKNLSDTSTDSTSVNVNHFSYSENDSTTIQGD